MSSSIKAPGLRTALIVLAGFGAALVALSLLAGPAVSGSTDLAVTKTADTNDGACTQSDCSLREAIVFSNTSGADAIDVPAGTYKLTRKGSGEDFAATGDLDVRRGVTIRGAGARQTIIDADGADRVFHTPFQNTSTPFTLAIFSMRITGGAVSGPGGGIFHDAQGATLHLGRSIVNGNQSGGSNQSGSGGGIMAQRGPLTVVESTISGNRAPGGQGGGLLIGGGGGSSTIANSTVSGNQSKFGGGVDTYEAVKIADSTIAFNAAQQPGGGLHVSGGPGPFTLKNTIVSNNTSQFAGFENCDANFVDSQGYNLEKGTSCGLDEPGDLNAAPMLGELANNGGPTNTHALLRGSPAINAGGDPFPSADQRLVARPQGFANDIGAYERRQDINVVLCPTGGSGADECVGTNARDALVGRDDNFDLIRGAEGDDIYNGKGSCDALHDASTTSTDRYVVTVVEFCNVGISSLSIRDDGGSEDVLDLSRFYASTDFEFSQGFTSLNMDGPGVNNIEVLSFFTPTSGATNSVNVFKFSDKTLTAKQIRGMVD